MSFINMVKRTRQNFSNPIVQTIDAAGSFFNSVKKPWFVIILVAMIGLEYIFYNFLEKLTQALSQQNSQNAQQIEILKNTNSSLISIEQELRDYHSFQKKRD